ncbi:MAG: hypothetical protein AAF514_09875 [Verrucomicrobiota bacterium]
MLSTNFAGSHFLALQLASHSRTLSIGEFHRLRRRGENRKENCYRCGADADCPVFRGLPGAPLPELYDRLFENLATFRPGLETVIDNSKKTEWAERYVGMPGYRQKYIHMIRDPRALVRRWIRTYERPSAKRQARWRTARKSGHFWKALTAPEGEVYLWKWLYQNRLITDFLKRCGGEHRVVTYHDLVFDQERVLKELTRWMGFEFEPSQREYWKMEHHGSVKPDYMKAPDEGRIFDQRWKADLDEETCRAALAHQPIKAYLQGLGLRLDEADGLVAQTGS